MLFRSNNTTVTPLRCSTTGFIAPAIGLPDQLEKVKDIGRYNYQGRTCVELLQLRRQCKRVFILLPQPTLSTGDQRWICRARFSGGRCSTNLACMLPLESTNMQNCVHAASTADRKSTRLNSSHVVISYAVFCLKKKKAHV